MLYIPGYCLLKASYADSVVGFVNASERGMQLEPLNVKFPMHCLHTYLKARFEYVNSQKEQLVVIVQAWHAFDVMLNPSPEEH